MTRRLVAPDDMTREQRAAFRDDAFAGEYEYATRDCDRCNGTGNKYAHGGECPRCHGTGAVSMFLGVWVSE